MAYTIRLKRSSAARWTSFNPVLAEGEPGVERDTGRMKLGDGVTPWNKLPYNSSVETGGDTVPLENHIASLTPHPVYDDGPSLVLIYENAKV